ncbi:MAG: cell division/cell wall cluster transcriptional repressor MraZ [Clostridia bacterium]|nr:cell division/cell wall cluster transcriptional repressor MraZ [Clostridia bacterium]
MFCGEYRLSLDDKGRMRIPNKLRAQLEDEFVISAAPGGCLMLLPRKEFERRFTARTETLNLRDRAEQTALRKLCSTACIPEEDSQGRFVLPAKLKTLGGIKKKLVFLGVVDRIEIWSEERYDEDYDPESIDMDEVVDALVI